MFGVGPDHVFGDVEDTGSLAQWAVARGLAADSAEVLHADTRHTSSDLWIEKASDDFVPWHDARAYVSHGGPRETCVVDQLLGEDMRIPDTDNLSARWSKSSRRNPSSIAQFSAASAKSTADATSAYFLPPTGYLLP